MQTRWLKFSSTLGILALFWQWLPGLVVAPAEAVADHIVISEIQIAAGATTDDFIELYNPTAADINLDDYRLVKRTKEGESDTNIKSFGSSDIIPAYGYFLWANSSYLTIGVTPDATTSQTIASDNGVALRQGPADTGAIIDSVGWGQAANIFVEGTAFASNPGAGESMERNPGATDSEHGNGDDSGNNVADFALRTASEPQNSSVREYPAGVNPPDPEEPGGDPEPVVSTQIWINEILPAPGSVTDWDGDGVANVNDEWIELYNADTVQIDLVNWTLDDIVDGGSNPYVFPAGSLIEPGGFLVMYKKDSGLVLNNTGDSVILSRPDTTIQDQFDYTSTATDTSFGRSVSGVGTWESNLDPTPGAVNVLPAPAGGGGGSTPTSSSTTTSGTTSSSMPTVSATTSTTSSSSQATTPAPPSSPAKITTPAVSSAPKTTAAPVATPAPKVPISSPAPVATSAASVPTVVRTPTQSIPKEPVAAISTYRPVIAMNLAGLPELEVIEPVQKEIRPQSVPATQPQPAVFPHQTKKPLVTQPLVVIPIMLIALVATLQYMIGLPVIHFVASITAQLVSAPQVLSQQHKDIIEQIFQRKE